MEAPLCEYTYLCRAGRRGIDRPAQVQYPFRLLAVTAEFQTPDVSREANGTILLTRLRLGASLLT